MNTTNIPTSTLPKQTVPKAEIPKTQVSLNKIHVHDVKETLNNEPNKNTNKFFKKLADKDTQIKIIYGIIFFLVLILIIIDFIAFLF